MQIALTSTFPERLRTILDETGIRQTDLCEKAGIGKSAMSQYLHGAFVPKQQKLSAIAEALNVSEGWLLGYDVPRMRRVHISEDALHNSEEGPYIEMRAPDDSMKGICVPKGARVLIKPIEDRATELLDGNIVCITVKGEKPKLRVLHKEGDKMVFVAADVTISPQVFTMEDLNVGNLTINGPASRVEIEL